MSHGIILIRGGGNNMLKMYKYELISVNGTEKCNWSSWHYYSVGEIMSLSGLKYKVVKVL